MSITVEQARRYQDQIADREFATSTLPQEQVVKFFDHAMSILSHRGEIECHEDVKSQVFAQVSPQMQEDLKDTFVTALSLYVLSRMKRESLENLLEGNSAHNMEYLQKFAVGTEGVTRALFVKSQLMTSKWLEAIRQATRDLK